MPRPGFYNDNEYRAYPFIYTPRTPTELTIPEKVIVDAGFILGLDADFNTATDTVWLESIARAGDVLVFSFKTDAIGGSNSVLTFSRAIAAGEWLTEYAQTAPAENVCAREPVWEGFLVTGPLSAAAAEIAADTTVVFEKNEYQIEPGRIQNLARTYLRSISVGNYARTTVPDCAAPQNEPQTVVLNSACMTGHIKFKEGYQCQIAQDSRTNIIDVSADQNAGAEKDETFCANGGELPLFPGETTDNKFFSGGPACDELIFSINGVGGRNVTILGGSGITITAAGDNALKLELNTNAQNACPPQNEPPL